MALPSDPFLLFFCFMKGPFIFMQFEYYTGADRDGYQCNISTSSIFLNLLPRKKIPTLHKHV